MSTKIINPQSIKVMFRRCGYSQSLTCVALGLRMDLDAGQSSLIGPRYQARIWRDRVLLWIQSGAKTKWDAVQSLCERVLYITSKRIEVSSDVIASDLYGQYILDQRHWLKGDVLSTVAMYDARRGVIFHVARKWTLATFDNRGQCSVTLDPHATKAYGPELEEALRQYHEWQGDEAWKRERMSYFISSQVRDRNGERPEVVASLSVKHADKVKQ
jgi:hypothetical protein